MSGLKLFAMVLLLAAMFSSCSNRNEPGYIPAGLESAIDDGIILYQPYADGLRYEIVEFKARDMSRTISFTSIHFAFTSHELLTFERTGGYVDVLVSIGDTVSEGDVLAVLSFEDETMAVQQREAEVRLERFMRGRRETINRLRAAIYDARENYESASSEDLIEWALRLELAEIEYELFITQSNLQLEVLTDALAQVNEVMAGDEILAPFDGLILNTFQQGNFLTANPIIVIIACYHDFYVIGDPWGIGTMEMPAQMSRYALFRYGDILLIRSQRTFVPEGGEVRPIVEFYVRVASDPWATGHRSLLTYTLIPLDRQDFFDSIEEAGLELHESFSLLLAMDMEINLTPNIYSVPIAAVRNVDWMTNYVRVLHNGVLSRRYVQLGVRDRAFSGYWQVLSGLEVGMQVVILR